MDFLITSPMGRAFLALLSVSVSAAAWADGGHPGPIKTWLLGRQEAAMVRAIRTGRYRTAHQCSVEMLKMQGLSCPSNAQCRSLASLSQFPDLTLEGRGGTQVAGEVFAHHLFVPVTVNGVAAFFFIDTGSSTSVLTESEARRLGLVVRDMDGDQIGDSAGIPVQIRKFALADTLLIGGLTYRHVVFLIAPDDVLFWRQLPAGRRGLLGLPLLLAAETLRWDRDGNVHFLAPVPVAMRSFSRLRLSGQVLHAELRIGVQNASFFLDTGSDHSVLYDSVIKDFPTLVPQPRTTETRRYGGFGGEVDMQVSVAPQARLGPAGAALYLRPAVVVPKPAKAGSLYGVIGFDLWQQAKEVAVDFKKETISVVVDRSVPEVSLSGQVAPDFTLRDLDNGQYQLSPLKGKTILLDFMATWCLPCQAASPILAKLQKEFGGEQLVILGINDSEDPNILTAFLQKHPVSYPVLLGRASSVHEDYHVTEYPTFVVVRPDGTVAAHEIGFYGEGQLRAMLRKAGAGLQPAASGELQPGQSRN